MNTKSKYTKELLEEHVAKNVSYAGILRTLGLRQSGGMQAHIIRRVKHFGIDTSHFTGQVHNKGKVALNKMSSDQILILLPDGSPRRRRLQLKRAMIEEGIEYKCALCFITAWRDLDICLEIDHINGNWLDNRIENVRFLCPNCHSQQENTNKPHKYKMVP
jgi:5-methylcytosine-specific restriction endonuclease McrA